MLQNKKFISIIKRENTLYIYQGIFTSTYTYTTLHTLKFLESFRLFFFMPLQAAKKKKMFGTSKRRTIVSEQLSAQQSYKCSTKI